MVSQQPPGESKTINISTKKCTNGFTTASWRIENNQYFNKTNVQMASRQPPGESKTINISTNKFANGFTTASWRIQNN